MARIIFIHFLDNEFISLFELNNSQRKFYLLQEFCFALRLALLICEDYIIIPLSNIAESPFITKAILNDLGKFSELGYVHLASKSLNLSEFIEEKQKQFSLDKNRCPLYFDPNFYNFLSRIELNWLFRYRNTTKDIANYWTNSIGDTSVWSEIFDSCNIKSIEIFEREIFKIPEKLDQQAFIADFVTPLLPFSSTPHLKNRINLLITKAYIKSYLDEYNAICMSGFTSLDTSILLPSNRYHILIYEINRALFRLQKFDHIHNMTSDELLKYKLSQEWDDLKISLTKSYRLLTSGIQDESENMDSMIQISGCDDKNRRADIIFVHGLDGDARTTWHPKDHPEAFWPTWLGEDVPTVGIWSLGYTVTASAWKGYTMPLADQATTILDILKLDGIGRRPVVFVCHSLGGLLVKQLLRHACDFGNLAWKRIATQTKAIVFLSTPHSGADLASWIQYIGGLLRTTVSVEELKAHHPRLRELNLWYRGQVASLGITTVVYYETRPVAGILVVNATTADPGIGGVIPIPINKNHVSICKPTSRDDQIYRGVKLLVEEIIFNSTIN